MPDFINSSAIILKPKPSFLAWLSTDAINQKLTVDMRELLTTMGIEVMRVNATVIAMPLIKHDLQSESKHFLATHAADILKTELLRWELASESLPAKPPFELLNEWFDISYHSRIIVFDDEAAQWKP